MTIGSEEDDLRQKIEELKKSIAQEKKEKFSQLIRNKFKLKKQTLYNYDPFQKRAKNAGYATESEKLIGGRTGYYSTPVGAVKVPDFVSQGARPEDVVSEKNMAGYLGDIAVTVAEAAEQVRLATEAVKSVTADVKHGVATRSDLLRAINNLDEKIKAAKNLAAESSVLSGFSETPTYNKWICIVGSIAVLYFIFGKF